MEIIEVKVRGVGEVEPKARRGYLEFLCVYPARAHLGNKRDTVYIIYEKTLELWNSIYS
jgi:hypothetical protein